jgi:AraC-like DNA-binding protein
VEGTAVPTHRVFGGVTSSRSLGDAVDVGLFSGSRLDAQPVAWQRTADGVFSLSVPQGSYYLHATSVRLHAADFSEALEWGTYGGVYGFGLPLQLDQDTGPLAITASPLGRDLLHMPKHRQLPVGELHAERVRHVERLLLADPSLSVDALPDRLSVHRAPLATTFRRSHGVTIEQYRNRVRVELAKALLMQTQAPLLHVAGEVGYESASQLSRVFQQLVGVTPGCFREFAAELRKGAAGPGKGADRERSEGTGRALLDRLLDRMSGTISGTVCYEGKRRGRIIYVGAFRTPTPSSYPVGWTALPRPGDFTLRCFFSGAIYVMACYCERSMRYPGDMRTAFADGACGRSRPLRRGEAADPSALTIQRGARLQGIVVPLFDNDAAARHSSPWTDVFLPDGR